MRQGYIDSQGNKYILTGVKAQFPRWTYAEWQAEGEPDIPWIRTDAPSGYRKVSGDDVSYDNNTSVNEKIDTKLSMPDVYERFEPIRLYDCNGLTPSYVFANKNCFKYTALAPQTTYNRPTGAGGGYLICYVWDNTSYGGQEFIDQDNQKIWYRRYNVNTWESWVQI